MYGIQIAFRDYKPARGFFGSQWKGFYWFERFFTAPTFRRMIVNTVKLSLYSLLWSFPVPIILALAINQLRFKKYKRVVQTVLYAPHFISIMVVCGMIRIFLSPYGGLINLLIGKQVDFMTVPEAFRTIYISSGIWQDAGWGTIIYLATFHDWYAEGLMDLEMFSQSTSQLISKVSQGRVGLTTWWEIKEIAGDHTDDFVFLPPMYGPAGTEYRSYNEYGKMWECPDFFALNGKQVLLVSPQDMSQVGLEFHNGNGTVCCIGAYDIETRRFERQRVQAIDYGIDFYAPQTLLTGDGRRVMIAWMQNWDTAVAYPAGTKWFGQMTLPRELRVQDGRLIQNPIRELEALRGRRVAYENVPVGEESNLKGIYGRMLDMTITLRPQQSKPYELFRLKFAKGSQHYSDLVYDPRSSTLRISRTHSGCTRDFVHERECFVRDRGGELKLRLILDRFSAEVFVNDGEQALSMTLYTPMTANGISFESRGAALMDVEKYEILP